MITSNRDTWGPISRRPEFGEVLIVWPSPTIVAQFKTRAH